MGILRNKAFWAGLGVGTALALAVLWTRPLDRDGRAPSPSLPEPPLASGIRVPDGSSAGLGPRLKGVFMDLLGRSSKTSPAVPVPPRGGTELEPAQPPEHLDAEPSRLEKLFRRKRTEREEIVSALRDMGGRSPSRHEAGRGLARPLGQSAGANSHLSPLLDEGPAAPGIGADRAPSGPRFGAKAAERFKPASPGAPPEGSTAATQSPPPQAGAYMEAPPPEGDPSGLRSGQAVPAPAPAPEGSSGSRTGGSSSPGKGKDAEAGDAKKAVARANCVSSGGTWSEPLSKCACPRNLELNAETNLCAAEAQAAAPPPCKIFYETPMYSGAFCKTVHCQGPGLRTCDIPWGNMLCEDRLKPGEEIGCGDLGEATQCGGEDYNWVNLICEAPCEHGQMRQYGTKKWDANCAAQGPAHRCVDAEGKCWCDLSEDYEVRTSGCGEKGCPPTQRRVYKKKNFDCMGQEEILLGCASEPPCVVSTQGGD